MYKTVGDHNFEINTSVPWIRDFFIKNFRPIKCNESTPDFQIIVEEEYGKSFVDYNVQITKKSGKLYFQRSDYLIEADTNFKKSRIYVHDELSLKHAMMNLYSSYIVYQRWGLMIHSSCAIEEGIAHIFAGQSGAGKSTAARLSQPRELLSDEATLVKISPDGIFVFDSPFRSGIETGGSVSAAPLASIQLLHQDLHNNRVLLGKADGLLNLMDKVFYWAHAPDETKKVMGLLKNLIEQVPSYNLHFKKDDTFWELIS